jgi:hypothetical protein
LSEAPFHYLVTSESATAEENSIFGNSECIYHHLFKYNLIHSWISIFYKLFLLILWRVYHRPPKVGHHHEYNGLQGLLLCSLLVDYRENRQQGRYIIWHIRYSHGSRLYYDFLPFTHLVCSHCSTGDI